VPCLL